MTYNNSIGIIHNLKNFFETEGRCVEELTSVGIETVQVLADDISLMTEENAEKLLKMTEGKLRITSVWAGWSGPNVWDSVDGPGTLGIVPEAYRAMRLLELKRGADFAAWLGVSDVATHVGFIPEQPCYAGYRDLVAAVADLADYCAKRELHFNFETGQETPVTLMRVFQDVGAENLGVNFDPANLILYGRGNPIDAIDIYGGRIRGVHVKDGDYTTDFYKLGKERVVGEGSVNYPVFLPKLLASGYHGDLYIEHEMTDRERLKDIKQTVQYIRGLMRQEV